MHIEQSSPVLANPTGCLSQMPQPGEIWHVSSSVQSPLKFTPEEQRRLYSEPALSFLRGSSTPRYVMIVTEAEQVAEKGWPTISVMVLSLETQCLSKGDILMPTSLSGLEREVLVETWHVQEMLACNLSHRVGQRLSRHVYDLLLTIGDFHQGFVNQLSFQEVQKLGLKIGPISAATNPVLQAFHRQEEAWSDVLTVPLAAHRSYLKGIQRSEQVLQAAISLEREFTVHKQQVNLSRWFEGCIDAGWQIFSGWLEETPALVLATRSSDTPADPTEIAALIHQLSAETDEPQRRRIAKQLGDCARGNPSAIHALIDLLRSTQDDETLWAAVESLWKIDPGNPAAGVQQVKLVDLGMQVANQAVALAVALVQKTNQHVGVLLQVYPTGSEPYLPANLTLVLLDEAGHPLREVMARQSDIYIQLKFRGEPSEMFSVRIELGTASITEDFVI